MHFLMRATQIDSTKRAFRHINLFVPRCQRCYQADVHELCMQINARAGDPLKFRFGSRERAARRRRESERATGRRTGDLSGQFGHNNRSLVSWLVRYKYNSPPRLAGRRT